MPDPTLKRNPDVVFREEDETTGEHAAVLFHPGNDKAFALNSMGKKAWEALEEPTSQSELVKQLLAGYDDVPDDAGQVIDDFLGQLIDHDLILRDGDA